MDGDRGTNAGAAYVFQRDRGGIDTWGEVTKLTASDAQGGEQFGVGVALAGDVAVVGASAEDSDEGGANNWGEVTKLSASDAQGGDQFGICVAASGTTAVVGAYWKGFDVGAAYVFQAANPTPNPGASPVGGIAEIPGVIASPTNELTSSRTDMLSIVWAFGAISAIGIAGAAWRLGSRLSD